jgi:hypothetical protein
MSTSLERSQSRDSRTRQSTSSEHLGDLVETVGQIWGVPHDTLSRDAASLRANPLEKLYMNDLKRALSAISLSRNTAQKTRHADLNRRLARLIRDFPELAIPTSPMDPRRPEDYFFTPPRKSETFARLMKIAGGCDLVARCREVWGVGDDRERDAEIEGLVHKWGESVGASDEMTWASPLVDAISDIELEQAHDISPVLQHLVTALLSLLAPAISSIFPLQHAAAPPPSLVPLLSLKQINTQPQVVKTADALSDELKGHAITEYVTVIGEMSSAGTVDGFERAAEWIEHEVSDIKRFWGSCSRMYVSFPDAACSMLTVQAVEPCGYCIVQAIAIVLGRAICSGQAIWQRICRDLWALRNDRKAAGPVGRAMSRVCSHPPLMLS